MPVGTIVVELLLGVTLKDVPEHIAAGVTSDIVGFGLTVTVIVKGVPTQLPVSPEVGVTV